MISIIVPIFNVESFIPTTIQSLIHQDTSVDYEVILVDDGSTDGSAVLCDDYAQENSRITVLHKPNGGLSSARNAGLEIAHGEYIMFLDGDDCLDFCTIRVLNQWCIAHNKCDFLQFQYEEVHPAAPFGHIVNDTLDDYYEIDNEHDTFKRLYDLGGVAASACTKLIKRSTIGDLRFKEGITHEDEKFTTELLKRCQLVGYCNNRFYKYAMRVGSIIHSGFSVKRMDIIPIFVERIKYLKCRGWQDLTDLFSSRFFMNLCLLWDSAFASGDKVSVYRIEEKIGILCSENRIKPIGVETNIKYKTWRCRKISFRTIFYLKKISKPFVLKIRNIRTKVNNKKECKRHRKLLTEANTNFSIISNNCWGGLVYQYFGLPYTSPTIGLFFMDDDYIRFLERLDYYLAQPLRFISIGESRYKQKLLSESTAKVNYPIALLDDIEVHFLHYKSEKEAEEKWNRRIKRLNRDRLLIKMSQRSLDSKEMLDRFEALPFKNKVCFTEYKRENPIFITIPELHLLNIQGGDETPFVIEKVDLVKIINKLK